MYGCWLNPLGSPMQLERSSSFSSGLDSPVQQLIQAVDRVGSGETLALVTPGLENTHDQESGWNSKLWVSECLYRIIQ